MPKPIKSAVAYLRRSDSKQEDSLETQRDIIQRFANDQAISITDWYVDDGISGDNENRPEFQRFMDDAMASRVDLIICRNQSRFARFDHDITSSYLASLRKAGVRLITVEDGEIGTDDLGSFIKSAVDAHGNKKYLTDLSKNTIAGQARHAKLGNLPGCPAPFGFDRMYVDADGNSEFAMVKDSSNTNHGGAFSFRPRMKRKSESFSGSFTNTLIHPRECAALLKS